MGRKPAQKYDSETATQVSEMAGYGADERTIAIMLDLDPKTLQRLYSHEFETDRIKGNAAISERLLQKALEGNTTCLIFWTKARLGWREQGRREELPGGGEPSVAEEVRAAFANLGR